MNFDVICSRGSNAYLVRYGEEYCMVNLATGRYNANEEAGVFLKLGYFEDVDQLSQEILDKIEKILGDPACRVEI